MENIILNNEKYKNSEIQQVKKIYKIRKSEFSVYFTLVFKPLNLN